jgi:hypothetical protein
LNKWNNVAKSLRPDRGDSVAVVGNGNFRCPRAWQGARGAALARLWVFARLSFTRTDRMGAGPECPACLLVWRPKVLSRALERRWVRPMLDPDPDRQWVELRPIADRDQTRTGRCAARPNKRPQLKTLRPESSGTSTIYNWIRNRSGAVRDSRHHSQTETRRIRQP